MPYIIPLRDLPKNLALVVHLLFYASLAYPAHLWCTSEGFEKAPEMTVFAAALFDALLQLMDLVDGVVPREIQRMGYVMSDEVRLVFVPETMSAADDVLWELA